MRIRIRIEMKWNGINDQQKKIKLQKEEENEITFQAETEIKRKKNFFFVFFFLLVDVVTGKFNKSQSKKYRVLQIPFFWKMLKKTTEYFLKFLFLFESTILPVNNGK